MEKKITVKLVHSPRGRYPKQRATVKGLGLSKVGGERVLVDTPQTRGMAAKVPHLVRIVEA